MFPKYKQRLESTLYSFKYISILKFSYLNFTILFKILIFFFQTQIKTLFRMNFNTFQQKPTANFVLVFAWFARLFIYVNRKCLLYQVNWVYVWFHLLWKTIASSSSMLFTVTSQKRYIKPQPPYDLSWLVAWRIHESLFYPKEIKWPKSLFILHIIFVRCSFDCVCYCI